MTAQYPEDTTPHPEDVLTKLDPAPDPVDAARKRASDYVSNISTNTKLIIRQRRDELDNFMARLTTSEEALTHYIGEFARFNHEALQIAADIKIAIDNAAKPFSKDPPATITQPKNGG